MVDFKPNIDSFALDPLWLNARMLFIAGPRQVGKTSFCKIKLKEKEGRYFNWDEQKVYSAYLQDKEDFFVKDLKHDSLVVFDEIHKRYKWKDILKGIFDAHRYNFQIIVSGSARLDTFKRSGDSLVGRYFLTHLFPISIGDLIKLDFQEYHSANHLLETAFNVDPKINQSELEQLIQLSGFPEPFFSGKNTFYKRWSYQHDELLIREDLKDLSQIQNIDGIEKLKLLLKERVASPLSINSLAEDIGTKPDSIRKWILQLEKIMLIFKVDPWNKNLKRIIKKSPKIYFYDWASLSHSEGARFENFVAMQLFKACTLWKDRYGQDFSLNYIRSYDDQEVDFLISLDSKPWLLIEAKFGKPEANRAIYHFGELLKVPGLVISSQDGFNYKKGNIYFMSALRFFSSLP
jgi:predicted AAA+ superfamily ATPase